MDCVTIRDVHTAMKAQESGTFGPLKAFLVNFEAATDFPRKFYYHGCTRTVGGGRPCSKTVEGLYACPHNSTSIQDGKWCQMYRFDIFLADGSIGNDCPPLRASIFQAATDLIGHSPAKFSLLPAIEQYSIVHALTTKMLEVHCSVHLKHHAGHMSCIIQSLAVLGDEDCQILHSKMPTSSTPKRSTGRPISSPAIYQTPRTTRSGAGDISSSSPAGNPSPGLSVVKAKL